MEFYRLCFVCVCSVSSALLSHTLDEIAHRYRLIFSSSCDHDKLHPQIRCVPARTIQRRPHNLTLFTSFHPDNSLLGLNSADNHPRHCHHLPADLPRTARAKNDHPTLHAFLGSLPCVCPLILVSPSITSYILSPLRVSTRSTRDQSAANTFDEVAHHFEVLARYRRLITRRPRPACRVCLLTPYE